MRLKSRVRPIPNGFRFKQPEINWDSVKVLGKFPSWEVLVNAVIAMRHGNPHHREKHQWATDVESVAAEVDAFNVQLCITNGWNQFIIGGSGGAAPRPLPQPRSPDQEKLLGAAAAKAKKIWSGVKTLNDWLDSHEPPVPWEESEARAAVCIACPLNGKGDFTRFFTIPAAASIKRQLERVNQRGMFGSRDAELGVCEACLCPLVIKTKTPIKFIRPHVTGEMIDELRKGKDCWVVEEIGRDAKEAAEA